MTKYHNKTIIKAYAKCRKAVKNRKERRGEGASVNTDWVSWNWGPRGQFIGKNGLFGGLGRWARRSDPPGPAAWTAGAGGSEPPCPAAWATEAGRFASFRSGGFFGRSGPPKNIPGPVPRSSRRPGHFKYHIGILSVIFPNGLRCGRTVAKSKFEYSQLPPTGYHKNDLWEPVAVWRGKFWGSAEEEAPPLYYEMKWSNAWIYVCNLKMFLPLNEGLKRDFTSQWGLEKMLCLLMRAWKDVLPLRGLEKMFCLLMRAWKDVLPLRGLEKMFCLLMRAWKDVLPLRGLEHMSCLLEDLKRCFAS